MYFELFNDDPESYLLEAIDHGCVDESTVIRSLLYYLSSSDVRDVIRETVGEPTECCEECQDHFEQEDIEYRQDDEVGDDRCEGWYCNDCYSEIRQELESEDDEGNDDDHKCGCGEKLNEQNECPKCSEDPEY